MDNLLSLQAAAAPSVQDELKAQITKVVTTDVKSGPGRVKLQSLLLPGDTEERLANIAINGIFYDVNEFYNWYFDSADDRSVDVRWLLRDFKPVNLVASDPLKKAVIASVDANLVEMRKPPSEVPVERDLPGLENEIVSKLIAYIVYWQEWFWDRYKEDVVDDYYDSVAENDQIYDDDEYGDLTNLDSGVLDGTDVPYYG